MTFALWLSGAGLLPTADAIETATIALEGVSGAGWAVRDLVIELSPLPGRGARLEATTVTLPGLPEPLRAVKIDCPQFTLAARRIDCAQARIDALVPALGRQRFSAAVAFALDTGALSVAIAGLDLAGGVAEVSGTLRRSDWTLAVKLKDAQLAGLLEVARRWALPLPPLTATGAATLDLTAAGNERNIASIRFTTALSGLTAANEAGTLASDQLRLGLRGALDRDPAGWEFELTASSDQGQVYVDPVFLDFGRHALDAQARGRWSGRSAEIASFRVEHRDVLRAHGSAMVDLAASLPLREADIDLERLDFPGAFTSYLQPFLIATGFKELDSSGSVAGRIVLRDGAPEGVDLAFNDMSAEDGRGQNAVYGLRGAVHWSGQRTGAPAPDSQLSLQGGRLLALDLGATTVAFRTQARDFTLLSPTRIPLLDGLLELDRFAVQAAGLPEMSFALDANLTPISLQRLSRAFGWPEFGGQLGGRISDLKLNDGVLTLSTTLQALVFDGRLEISDLRLEQPFGDWPRLYSSIDIYNLDLEQVTSAFSFGRITGRLSGYINELALFNWMPVEFDARLYTPPDDRSRHRISQRAVQNIGNLGGGGAGVGAALSSGLMGFFDEFNYDRLGISCRLENEVCLMDGVDPAPQGGYYLVKGRGLPRIDVIGNAAQVDWPRLIAQIKAILESEGPVVE